MSKPDMHITMLSDYICPWCYVAKIRLNRIIDSLADEMRVTLHLRPALLYPNIPEGGVDKALLAKKSKPGMGRSLRHEAKIEGVTIDYSQIDRIPNSRAAHRLTLLIDAHDQRQAVAMDIFEAYFSHGHDIESPDILTDICARHGVSSQIRERYHSGAGVNELSRILRENEQKNLGSVPTLLLTDQIVLPGLQSADVWENYLQRLSRI